MRYALILLQKPVKLLGRITFIPPGEPEIVFIELFEIGFAVRKRSRAVFVSEIKVRSEPVEHGHEIITHAFYADFAAVYYILLIRFDIFIARRKPEFYILVDGNAFDNFHRKICGVCKLLQFFKLFHAPHVAYRLVVNGSHDARHSLNLSDVIKRYAIVFAIPPKRQFHNIISFSPIVLSDLAYSILLL